MFEESKLRELVHSEKIQAAVVESIERRQMLGGFSTAFLSLLVCYNVSTETNRSLVWSWVVVVFLASAFKVLLSQCSRLSQCKNIRASTRSKLVVASAAATGILWSMPISFVDFKSPMELATIVLIVSGIISGSVNAYLGQKPCILWVSTCPCLSIVICLALKITPVPVVAIVSVGVFYIFIYFTSIHTKNTVYELLLAKHEKAVLVEQLQEKQKVLKELAGKDDLTGLPNRRLLVEFFEALARDCLRSGDKFAVLFIDMNDFKVVNDQYGHEIGDKVLIRAAQIMKEAVRRNDIVARLGGDEFVAVIKDVSDVRDAMAVAQKMSASLAGVLELDGCRVDISASIGASVYPDNGSSLDTLLHVADVSMYGDKRYCRLGET